MSESKTDETEVESTDLLAVLWDEYQDARDEARNALRMGDKLKALTLAIWANKIRNEYYYECSQILFS